MKQLTHLDEYGKAHMVDVSTKPMSTRMAVAKGEVVVKHETFQLIKEGNVKKGDVLSVAQIAGILAAKRTADLIPLCHPLQITDIDVELKLDESLPGVQIIAMVKTTGQTGVEMEALTAVAVAGLTIYDMVKAVDRGARIDRIRLVEKHGGSSGDVINE